MRNERSAEGPSAAVEEGMTGAAEGAGRSGSGGGAGGSRAITSRSVFEEPPLLMAAPRVGQPGRFKWMFAAVWLFYLIDPVAKVATSDHTTAFKTLIYVLVALFVLLYGWLAFMVYPKRGTIGVVNEAPATVAPILAVMALVAFVTSVFVDSDLAGMWVYVGAGAGLGLSMRDKSAYRGVLLSLVLMTVCVLASSDLRSVSTWLTLAFPIFFAGMSTLGIRQMAVLIGELREARNQVAHLATNEERLRLARDLHDLTGHSLSTITLKAELAQRMLAKARDAAPDGPTPRLDAALREVEEIEQVSRQTLTDIRQAVSGYRRATLAVEVASAYAALDAAGIKLDAAPSVAAATGEFDPQSESALAWCLREAVTNAIRHSGAGRVQITLDKVGDEMILTVRNNGRGLAATIGDTDECGGHGLTGLRERLDAVGGRLSVGGADGDFRLVAAAPVRLAGE